MAAGIAGGPRAAGGYARRASAACGGKGGIVGMRRGRLGGEGDLLMLAEDLQLRSCQVELGVLYYAWHREAWSLGFIGI